MSFEKYTDEQRAAYLKFAAERWNKETTESIAKKIGMPARTLRDWARKAGWLPNGAFSRKARRYVLGEAARSNFPAKRANSGILINGIRVFNYGALPPLKYAAIMFGFEPPKSYRLPRG